MTTQSTMPRRSRPLTEAEIDAVVKSRAQRFESMRNDAALGDPIAQYRMACMARAVATKVGLIAKRAGALGATGGVL